MNRTVATLRRTVGGGAMFALAFAAVSAGPHQPVPVLASTTAVPLTSSVIEADDPLPRQARAAVMIYAEATPSPVAPLAIRPARAPVAAFRPASRVAAAGPSWAVGAVSGAANGFTYGYCTWWVAHRRTVPWRGNAYQWWWNARAFGFAEGPGPRVGAIMVMGISGTSPEGHVAFVEAVNSNGSFLVSEMNWWGVRGGGWGRVDYRTVSSMRGVLGFIY